MATPSSPRLTILGLPHSAQGASDRTLTFKMGLERQVGPQYVVDNGVEESFKVRIFREIAFSYAFADFDYSPKHLRMVGPMRGKPGKTSQLHHPLFVVKMFCELLFNLAVNGREPFR